MLVLLALVLAPVAAAGAIRWRRALVMALPFLCTLNGIPLTVAGSSFHLDQLAAVALLVPLGAGIASGSRRLRMDGAAWLLSAILLLNVVVSAINSPAREYSLLQCANLATVWVIYLILLNFLDSDEEMALFFHRCLWAGALACTIAIAAYLLALVGMPVGGAEVSRSAVVSFTNAYGAYGTMVEPNIFGSFSGALFLVALTLLVLPNRWSAQADHPMLLRWLAAIAAAGTVLSFTRSAWIGVLCGIALLAALGAYTLGLRVRLSAIVVPLLVGLAIVLALLVMPGDAGTLFRYKVANLLNPASPTVAVRVINYTMALEQTLRHPVIGWGTFTFAPLAAEGADFRQFEGWRNLWIGNYLLLALHDTGLVGVALWVALLWTVLSRGARTIVALRPTHPYAAGRALALTVAVASLLVPFLATSGFSLGFPWLLMGLLGAHRRLLAREAPAGAAATRPIAPPGEWSREVAPPSAST
ncbi:MAG: hypothetical protein JWN53_1846 [Gemmatimonadetes bacterium]|nr:hypothetical protein [Gemmatimonadota bacterium]